MRLGLVSPPHFDAGVVIARPLSSVFSNAHGQCRRDRWSARFLLLPCYVGPVAQPTSVAEASLLRLATLGAVEVVVAQDDMLKTLELGHLEAW